MYDLLYSVKTQAKVGRFQNPTLKSCQIRLNPANPVESGHFFRMAIRFRPNHSNPVPVPARIPNPVAHWSVSHFPQTVKTSQGLKISMAIIFASSFTQLQIFSDTPMKTFYIVLARNCVQISMWYGKGQQRKPSSFKSGAVHPWQVIYTPPNNSQEPQIHKSRNYHWWVELTFRGSFSPIWLNANPPLFSMSKNAKWISWIEAEFDNQCGDTQNITLAEFTKVMGSKVSSS